MRKHFLKNIIFHLLVNFFLMARKALIVKCEAAHKEAERLRALGKKPKFPTRLYHRCSVTGRSRGYMRKFGMSRICIREKANAGELMGVRKSSW